MNNSTEGENHSEKETRSDLNILQRYLEMINEGDIELSALRLQAYRKIFISKNIISKHS